MDHPGSEAHPLLLAYLTEWFFLNNLFCNGGDGGGQRPNIAARHLCRKRRKGHYWICAQRRERGEEEEETSLAPQREGEREKHAGHTTEGPKSWKIKLLLGRNGIPPPPPLSLSPAELVVNPTLQGKRETHAKRKRASRPLDVLDL